MYKQTNEQYENIQAQYFDAGHLWSPSELFGENSFNLYNESACTFVDISHFNV